MNTDVQENSAINLASPKTPTDADRLRWYESDRRKIVLEQIVNRRRLEALQTALPLEIACAEAAFKTYPQAQYRKLDGTLSKPRGFHDLDALDRGWLIAVVRAVLATASSETS